MLKCNERSANRAEKMNTLKNIDSRDEEPKGGERSFHIHDFKNGVFFYIFEEFLIIRHKL